jgi:UDP-glucose 4-epimerase
MPSTLVTGGAGFIGSHVADALIAAGHRVVALDDLTGGFRENVNPAAEFVEGSILDAALVDRLFDAHRFEYVFHLAAYAAEGLSHFIKRFNYSNNLIGSVNLINAAVNAGTVKCFVFTSSIAVYGRNQLPMREDLVPEPEDPYGIAKYAVERELRASHEMFGLPFIVFRPHNVYGERQNIGDRYRNVVGIFMNQAMRGEPMTVFGDGLQSRAFTHIDDVAPVIARAIGVPAAVGEVFNIGADEACTVVELARLVAREMGVEHDIRHLPARQEVVHAYASHEKLDRVLGSAGSEAPAYVREGGYVHKGHVRLEDGIRRMAAWAKRHGSRESSKFSAIEIRKNLPPSWNV